MDPEQEEHRQRQARLQQIVAEVTERMEGRSVEEAMDALLAGAVASGLEPPSETWLRNVATSAVGGHVYVLSQEAVDDIDLEVPDLRTTQETAQKRGGDIPD
jgi:hypothetical protein